MHIGTPISEEISSYLNLSSAQLKLTAQNMANIDVPGYRTKGLDFEAEMQRSIDANRANQKSTDDPASPRTFEVGTFEVDGLLERPDGNNVSMDREGLKMAEAQLKFRTGVELIKREFNRVSDAIHEDK